MYGKHCLALWCAALAAGCSGQDDTVFADSSLNGLWLSEEYGMAVEAQDGSVRAYDYTDDVCVSVTDLGDRSLSLLDTIRRADEGDTLFLSAKVEPYEYRFDRARTLPAACERPTPDTPNGNLASVASFFGTHYPFFEQYGVDWNERVGKARSQLSGDMTDDELFDLLSELLEPLRDAHVELADGTRTFSANRGRVADELTSLAHADGKDPAVVRREFIGSVWTDVIGEDILVGSGVLTANGRIRYGLTEGGLGYIGLLTLGGFSSNPTDLKDERAVLSFALDDAITFFVEEGVPGVIIDLSMNLGGYDFLARDIASRFIDEPVQAYSKQPYFQPAEGRRAERGHTYIIEPADQPTFVGPTYVLTSDVTVSAGEVLTLVLRASPDTVQVGERTRGAFSDTLTKELPNGWSLSLSNEVYADADGRSWEGVGLEPDLEVPVLPVSQLPKTNHATAVRRIEAEHGNPAKVR